MTWKSITLPACLVAALLVSACGALSGKAYDQPLETVHRALENLDKPPMVFGTEQVAFIVAENTPNQIVWTVGRNGNPRVRLEAALSADSATSTRVKVNAVLVEKKPGSTEPALQSPEAVLALYKAAMEEQIDATLTHRPFDITALNSYVRAAAKANAGAITASGDEAVAGFKARDEENLARAKEDEARRAIAKSRGN